MTTDDFRQWLLDHHFHTIDADRLDAIQRELERVVRSGVDGAIVELGCYRGAMAAWMRHVLTDFGDARDIHVYDSFEGLPAPGPRDSDYLQQGDIRSSEDELLGLHAHWSLPPPIIHKGWFSETLPEGLPAAIAFGYLDGDLYDSILISLEFCAPRLVAGSTLIVDDYADVEANPKAWNGLPGVKRACDDFFDAPLDVLIGKGDLAFGAYRVPLHDLDGAGAREGSEGSPMRGAGRGH